MVCLLVYVVCLLFGGFVIGFVVIGWELGVGGIWFVWICCFGFIVICYFEVLFLVCCFVVLWVLFGWFSFVLWFWICVVCLGFILWLISIVCVWWFIVCGGVGLVCICLGLIMFYCDCMLICFQLYLFVVLLVGCVI